VVSVGIDADDLERPFAWVRRALYLALTFVALFPGRAPGTIEGDFAKRDDEARGHLDAGLKTFLQGYLSDPFGPDETTRVSFSAVDLSGGGVKEVLVYVSGRNWCGSGGCVLLVVAPPGSAHRVLSRITIARPPIRVLSSRTHGWRDLAVWVRGGGIITGYEAKLPFNGRSYASNPSMPPALPLQRETGTVVISPNDAGEQLYP